MFHIPNKIYTISRELCVCFLDSHYGVTHRPRTIYQSCFAKRMASSSRSSPQYLDHPKPLGTFYKSSLSVAPKISDMVWRMSFMANCYFLVSGVTPVSVRQRSPSFLRCTNIVALLSPSV